ncbi:11700_t:CDS:1, partial [Rhizophagus irregularis]
VIITTTAGVSISTISKRETVARCPDRNFPVFVGSFCKTETSMTVQCKNGNNVMASHQQQCNPSEKCIDFVLNDEVPFAMCVPRSKLLSWTNGNHNDKVCSGTIRFDSGATSETITIGFNTYDTNGNPIQVFDVVGRVNNQQIGEVENQHNYSQIINNYKLHDIVSFCFMPGISDPNDPAFANEVIAYAYIVRLSSIGKVAQFTDIEPVISLN